MTISKNPLFCNRGNNTTDLVLAQGNIIPYLWYHKILKSCGKPDATAIAVLSDLFDRYTKSKNSCLEFQISYAELCTKYNYSARQFYNAVIRLEEMGLVQRKRSSVEIEGKFLGNFLFLTLNLEALLKLHAEYSDINDKGNGTGLSLPKTTGSTCKNLQVPYIDNINLRNNINLDINNRLLVKERSNALDSSGKYNNLELSRLTNTAKSVHSNNLSDTQTSTFCKPQLIKASDTSKIKPLARTCKKSLSDFYPLSNEDTEHLNISSGREFNAHFVNQLLLKLSSENPTHAFASKALFMKYMTKALACEMRQAVVVNNDSFKLIRNAKDSHIESYLNYIENSRSTAPFERLRKKIAVSFDSVTSYKILTKARFYENKNDSAFNITAPTDVLELLTPYIKERLLNDVRATYGNHIIHLKVRSNSELRTDTIKRNIVGTKVSAQKATEVDASKAATNSIQNTLLQTELETTPIHLAIDNSSNSPGTIWGKIRKSLRDYYGEGVDRSWFSRLEATENSKTNTLDLKAPGSFIKDYIEQHYKYLMDNVCRQVSDGSFKLSLQSI